jgi:hypothetical protein
MESQMHMENKILEDSEIQKMVSAKDKTPYGQNLLVFSYVPKAEFKEQAVGMIKFRGVFSDKDQAHKFIREIEVDDVDSQVTILVGETGKWGLLKDPSILGAKDNVDLVYENNEHLTKIMKGFYDNEKNVKAHMQERITFMKDKVRNIESGKYAEDVKKSLTKVEIADFIKLKEEKIHNLTVELELLEKEISIDRLTHDSLEEVATTSSSV